MKIVKKILVTGATGYIGGRLVPRLLEKGYQVRVFVRDPGRLIGRTWFENVEVVEGDVLDPKTLPLAMQDVDAAYYMIHSMSKNNDFHERDITAAKNFGDAATHAGVKQLIYLGGLGDSEGELSEHLRSRQETGDALRRSGVPVTEFRAAVIVGSGSISFEMIRYLTERVPLMVCPRWVYTKVQPIAIRDVLNYLVSALETPGALGEIIEIGGQDLITYGDMMRGYANVRGLRRGLIPVPFLTPYLSSYWVHWVTPIPASIARPLIEGLRTEVIVKNDLAEKVFPDIQPIGYEDAVKRALDRLDASQVETSWSDSLFSSQQDAAPVQLTTQDGMIIENRQTIVTAAPEEVFKSFTRIGGNHGYGYMNWAWRLRGILDRFVGGVGFRRGRRDPEEMRVGDAVDFWRVETVEPGHLIRLRAEMKVPGDAWLQYKAQTMPDGKTQLSQTAFFAPKGLFGLLYWYILYPVHSLIFSGMIENLKRQAERSSIPVASKLSGY